MKHRGLFIAIMIILTITTMNIYRLISTKKLAINYRQENAKLDKRIIQLKQQAANDKVTHEAEIQEALKQSQEADVIFGYIVGYLTAHNATRLITSDLTEFTSVMARYAHESMVKSYDIMTICQIESSFCLNPPTGPAGEEGPMQVTPEVWKLYYHRFGYKMSDFKKWQCNSRVGVCFYADLLKQNGGDAEIAIGYYNGGGNWRHKIQTKRHLQKFMIASRGISRLKGRGKEN